MGFLHLQVFKALKIFAVLGNFGAGRSLFKKGWALPALFCGRDFDFDKDRVKGFAVIGTLFPQDMEDLQASHPANRLKRLLRQYWLFR